MKKYLLFIYLLLFPLVVNAASGSISVVCPASAGANETFNCSITAYSSDGDISGFQSKLSLSSNVSCTSVSSNVFTANLSGTNLLLELKNAPVASGTTIATLTCSTVNATTNQTIGFTSNKMGVEVSGSTEKASPSDISQTIKVKSTDATLSSLTISDGDMFPSFSPSEINYSVSTDQASITISAVANSSGATVTGTGTKSLNYGDNTFPIVVTAEAGNTKTYTIIVTREDNRSSDSTLKSITLSTGSINFEKTKTEYSLTIETGSIEVTGTPNDDKATISYSPKNTVELNYSETKKIEILVTAENGSQKTYTLNITRKDTRSTDNTLKSLTLSSGSINFSKTRTNYSVTINSNESALEITGVPTDALAKVSYSPSKIIAIAKGETKTINVVVTAENGSKKTYTVVVTRKDDRSNNNNLSNLTVNNYDIKFNKSKTEYTLEVENNIESVYITAVPENNRAKISGSGEIKLKEGSNVVPIIVTAENGLKKIYTITVVRKTTGETNLSDNNYLQELKIDNVSIIFNKNKEIYNIYIPHNIEKLNLIYKTEHEKATVIEDGNNSLKEGNNLILLNVIAENGTKRVYKIYVTKINENTLINPNKMELKEKINALDNLTLILNVNNQNIIDAEILELLKNSNKNLLLIVTNSNKEVLYQYEINGLSIEDTVKVFNPILKLNAPQNIKDLGELTNKEYKYLDFTNNENFLGRVNLKVFVGDLFKDNEKMYLYQVINGKVTHKNLESISENGYASFTFNQKGEYLILNEKLLLDEDIQIMEEEKRNVLKIVIALTMIAIIIVSLFIFLVLKKKKKTYDNLTIK